MDSRYIVPGQVAIGKELDKVVIELKAKISSFLLEVNKSRICVDIWSKKGMSSFYLGISAHFYSSKDHRRHSVTLAMRHMPQTHTGNNIHEIIKSVLDEWDIPSSKISATLTDNGSNMIAAFRPQILEAESDDNTEENQDTEESGEDSEQLSREFEEKESEHDIAFTGLNKVSCFTHTLQLVVHKFEELAEFKSILKRAHSLVRKFNMSANATEKLIAKCGKKLVRNCPTQRAQPTYSSNGCLQSEAHFPSFERIGVGRLGNHAVSGEVWKLSEIYFTHLPSIHHWLKVKPTPPYRSAVIPAIMELNLHLEELINHTEVGVATRVLQKELKRRCRKFTDPIDSVFEHLFLLITSLDPRCNPSRCCQDRAVKGNQS